MFVLWATSYFPENFYLRSHEGRMLLIFAAQNHAAMFEEPRSFNTRDAMVAEARRYSKMKSEGLLHWQALGFEITLSDRKSGFWLFAVPYWALALPLAVFPAWALWTTGRRERWGKSGRCLQCGYDLRASKDQCPECGTPIPQTRKG